jgi:glyoxylase-like metal-dependent hydrolase (beta-lactamase superfamily II)
MKIQLETSSLVIFESALWRTTSSLIVSDDYIMLVDPNYLIREIEFIAAYINKKFSEHKKYLLFTHSDFDHIVGYGHFSDYTTIASENFVENPSKDKCIQAVYNYDEEHYIKRDYLVVYPEIDIVIASDHHVVNIEEDSYLFIQAPGHNADGLITYNQTKKILVVGDYLSNIEFPFIYHSIEDYKNVLEKLTLLLEEKDIDILISGHGDFTSDKSEMDNRISESQSYLTALKKSIVDNSGFDIDCLIDRYGFSSALRTCHEKNISFLK